VACGSAAIAGNAGNAGRYMSIANGRGQKPEHDGVTGERRGHEIFFFCSVMAVLGVGSRRLERLQPVFR
jgi:hypothetical protein